MNQIIDGSAVEPEMRAPLASNAPDSVVLDFVHPKCARRRFGGPSTSAARRAPVPVTGNPERAVPDARRTILVLLSDEVDNPPGGRALLAA
jgi:hypothetical protein